MWSRMQNSSCLVETSPYQDRRKAPYGVLLNHPQDSGVRKGSKYTQKGPGLLVPWEAWRSQSWSAPIEICFSQGRSSRPRALGINHTCYTSSTLNLALRNKIAINRTQYTWGQLPGPQQNKPEVPVMPLGVSCWRHSKGLTHLGALMVPEEHQHYWGRGATPPSWGTSQHWHNLS